MEQPHRGQAKRAGSRAKQAKGRAKRRRSTRSAAPATESQIYDGSTHLGDVIERGRVFTARTPNGRKLGTFSSIRDAMRSIREGYRQIASALRVPE